LSFGLRSKDKFGAPNALNEYYVSNSIVWQNGVAILSDYDPDHIQIEYSNVDETWPGVGNIRQNPLFVSADDHNYCLQEDSPSIDSGAPDSALEPDGSRADQGFCRTERH